jgi:hypothetical protein
MGGINRVFLDRIRLSVIFDYPANGNRSLARIIEVLVYLKIATIGAANFGRAPEDL